MTRRTLSNVIVALLGLYALASVVVVALPFWQPAGTLGFVTDYALTARSVSPGGPAAAAGMAAGDRIVVAAVPLTQRRYLAGPGSSIPIGTELHFPIVHDGLTRTIALTAVPAPFGVADRWTLFIQCASSLVFVVVGVGLIVLRPTAATWGFGAYCLLVLPTGAFPTALPGTGWALLATAVYDVVQNLGVMGLVLFALEFPRPFALRWRERLRAALPAMTVVLIAMTLYPDIANLIFGIGARIENRVLQIVFGAVFALSIGILWDTFRRVAIDERERLRWILAGFCLGIVTNYIGNTIVFSTLIAGDPPLWFVTLLVSLNVLLPINVAYAVVRHRVLDIEFVIGQAIVFAILTSALAGVFGILDWFFGSMLEDFRFTHYVQAAISISVAFIIGRLEKRTHHFVETLFFRKRRAAEARLDHVVRSLPRTESVALIEKALVNDGTSNLELETAAVFRAGEGGAFFRAACSGWDETHSTRIDANDPLVHALRATPDVVDLIALDWRRDDVPRGGGRPILALPMLAQSDLAGFTLYSGHVNGSSIDPGERALLERLVDAASLALEHIDAQRLRAENAELRARLTASQPAT